MQLPDESIEYDFRRLLVPQTEAWTPLAVLQAEHFLPPERLDAMRTMLTSVRGQIASERELLNPPPKLQPLQPGFIDLPQKTLDAFRKRGDASELGKILRHATRLKEECDRVVVLGTGGTYLGPRALFQALSHTHHNEMPAKLRAGRPRLYFEGNGFDNDSLQDLLELFENNCVDPASVEERYGVVVISKSGGTLETAAAYRALRAEVIKYYGPRSPWVKKLVVPVTGTKGKLREMCTADGYADDDVLTIPDDVGSRYAVFSPAGLLPAAVLGLDVRAILLGAASMTRRFLEEPFDKNPVLQFAAVNHVMTAERNKPTRVLAVWSKKLEAVGQWYDHLLSESLGKAGKGATPITAVYSRDLHTRGQQHQEGPWDKLTNNIWVRTPKHPPLMIGMADRNEDDLNSVSRKGFPDLHEAACRATNQACYEAARPTADIILPTVSEHTIGQLLQMLMLATVVEGRLAGTNPYGQPGVELYKRYTTANVRATPNLPKGEVRDQTKGY